MNIDNLLGAEILFREELNNSLLIKIPRTKHHLLMKKHNDTWQPYVITLKSAKRYKVAGVISTEQAETMIQSIFNRDFKDINKLSAQEIAERLTIIN